MKIKRLVTPDDFVESYFKFLQKGPLFFLKKFNISSKARTIATFNYSGNQSSNYWIIPEVKKRWNQIISGNENLAYENYVYEKYLKDKSDLSMLSAGSGISSHEMLFAAFGCFREVTCMDISGNMIGKAKEIAVQKALFNMNFVTEDFQTANLPEDYYDVILFNSSLHHFKNLHLLIPKVKKALKNDGIIILNEYVGPRRIIYSQKQVKAINSILHLIPQKYRRRLKSGIIKKQVSGPGYLRMVITDPSEAVESDLIRPIMHQHFRILEERNMGGNIIMLLFKDIAHNFLDGSDETLAILGKIFKAEDTFLKTNESDFIFGIYGKKINTI